MFILALYTTVKTWIQKVCIMDSHLLYTEENPSISDGINRPCGNNGTRSKCNTERPILCDFSCMWILKEGITKVIFVVTRGGVWTVGDSDVNDLNV